MMGEESKLYSLLQNNTALCMLLQKYGVERLKGKAAQMGMKLDSERSVKLVLQALATENQMGLEALQDLADDDGGVKISVGDYDLPNKFNA